MHNRTHKVYLWFIVLFCTYQHILTQAACTSPVDQPWITIMVHGILSVKPFLSPYNIYILMQDDIHGSVYANTICLARQDPFFQQYHAMQEIGLIKIDMETVTKGHAASAFARSYEQLTQYVSPENNNNTYYTYGWSALLSKKLWEHEGQRFYQSVAKKVAEYRAQGIEPKIRIIGYSHGGTVAMHLAQAHKTTDHISPFTVDELILVGMPGLPETKELIHSPLFKKIYHIYSHGDRVQTFDFFSMNVLFSKQIFLGCKRKPLPKNFYQIGIKMYRPAKHCIRKCTGGHPQTAPARHLRPAHPGHTELWSFGWGGGGYRPYFPLYPLPIGVCIPWLTHISDQFSDCSPLITIALHPYAQHAEVYCHESYKRYPLPGIPSNLISEMQQDALLFCPEQTGSKMYARHLKAAINKANEAMRTGN